MVQYESWPPAKEIPYPMIGASGFMLGDEDAQQHLDKVIVINSFAS